jgi:hypothetical protein
MCVCVCVCDHRRVRTDLPAGTNVTYLLVKMLSILQRRSGRFTPRARTTPISLVLHIIAWSL